MGNKRPIRSKVFMLHVAILLPTRDPKAVVVSQLCEQWPRPHRPIVNPHMFNAAAHEVPLAI